MAYTSSSFRAETESAGCYGKFRRWYTGQTGEVAVDHGKCPRCNHTVSESVFKNNKCKKKSKFVECCNAKVRKDGPGQASGAGRAPRTDDAAIYRSGCCGPWPGHEKVEDEDVEEPKLEGVCK
jgi:hypothetical protein